MDVQENADRNLEILIDCLAEMRWAVSGVHAQGVACLPAFDDGVAKLNEALTAIKATRVTTPATRS